MAIFPMKRAPRLTIVTVTTVSLATFASLAVAQAKFPAVRAESELKSLSTSAATTLRALESERDLACRGNSRSSACITKSEHLSAQRPALEQKIHKQATHEAEARAGKLTKPNSGVVVPASPGGNCMTCHTAPTAMGAPDPIVTDQGAKTSIYPPNDQGKRCFIATAAFGADSPEVSFLRDFRDRHLVGHVGGDWLVETYYRFSPPVADFIDDHNAARILVRGLIHFVISAIKTPMAAVLTLGTLFLLAVWVFIRRSRTLVTAFKRGCR